MVGFWVPEVLDNVNVAGFHFRAITAGATAGGHVLDCESADAEVEVDYLTEVLIQFADHERGIRRR